MRISDWSSDVCSSDLREPAVGPRVMRQIIAAAPVRVGHDRLAADLVEGDVLRRAARRRGDRDGGEHAFGIARRPVEALPAAHGAADRKSVVEGKGVSVGVDLGGRRIITKKKNTHRTLDNKSNINTYHITYTHYTNK